MQNPILSSTRNSVSSWYSITLLPTLSWDMGKWNGLKIMTGDNSKAVIYVTTETTEGSWCPNLQYTLWLLCSDSITVNTRKLTKQLP